MRNFMRSGCLLAAAMLMLTLAPASAYAEPRGGILINLSNLP